MSVLKNFLSSVRNKLFGRKTVNLSLIEEKHPIQVSNSLHPLVVEKSIKEASSITQALKLAELDKKTDELISKSIHSSQEIHEQALQEVKQFHKLNDLDLGKTMEKLSKTSSNSPDFKSVAVEVKKHVIVTDFDRINSLVKEKQKISLNSVAKQLKLSPKRVAECANVLEKSGLIVIDYPTIGAPQLLVKNFNSNQLKKNSKSK